MLKICFAFFTFHLRSIKMPTRSRNFKALKVVFKTIFSMWREGVTVSVCKTLLGKAPSPLPRFAHKRGHGRQEDRQKQSCSGRVSESRHRQSGMSPWKEAASEPAPPARPRSGLRPGLPSSPGLLPLPPLLPRPPPLLTHLAGGPTFITADPTKAPDSSSKQL